MHSPSLFVLCTIAIFLFMVSSSTVVAEEHHIAPARKLTNAAWLGAPHFQQLSKRGRMVFRDAPQHYDHELTKNDVEYNEDFLTKRNWRL
ncbi:unnamed protein product [Adineta steineri]|uniref:Uncharacterized protein n=1 Tax=Adineta steineri TaxID=433720 RepID=A0A814WPE2_9BILA|nr:unnamed protein product [Adineta steineri]CAF1206701.1 unnamed protein product [Adineta steineri]CAF1454618.1 unnamed protein product [Adineta steineri]CAF3809601.1 unnamed protein product [Adineta steineri]